MYPTDTTIRTYSSRSVPRPTPTTCARAFQASGKRTEATAKSTNAIRATRRSARWRAPRGARRPISATELMATSRMTLIHMGDLLVEEFGEDVHGVEQRLPLLAGVVGVEDVHRLLDVPESGLPDLLDDLRGVRHAVLLDRERGRPGAVERTQTIVRVRQPHACGGVREGDRGLEHELLQ